MNTKSLLTACILLGMANQSPAQSCPNGNCPVVVVVGTSTGTAIWLGGTGGMYTSGNSPTQDPFENLDPEPPKPVPMPDFCAAVAQHGLPEGCSRQYLQSGYPSFQFPTSSTQLNGMRNAVGSYFFSFNDAALSGCYANPTNDPSYCEAQYVAGAESLCDLMTGTSPSVGYDPRYYCDQGINHLGSVTFPTVQNNRAIANFFGAGIGVSVGAFEIPVTLASTLLAPDPWNQHLLALRQYVNCSNLIGAFDANGCSQFFTVN